MELRSFYSLAVTMSVLSYFLGVCTPQGMTEQVSCYRGTVQSNTRGQLPLDSELQLSSLPCGDPVVATTQPTQTAEAAVPTKAQNPTQPPGVTASATTEPASQRPVNTCAVFKYMNGPKLTVNVTWSANFTCVADGNCTSGFFCCSGSNCNSLSFFRQKSGAKTATVSKCLVGKKNSTASQVFVANCQGVSHYCFNRTINDEGTKFGCSNDQTESMCQNTTDTRPCTQMLNGSLTVCCCASDSCNGPPRNKSIHYTDYTTLEPTVTSPYLVTANKPTSNWLLALFIAAGVLIGGLVGVVVMVVCRRWKKKRTSNGPLNISYSRVSADLANEDDDNIFSY